MTWNDNKVEEEGGEKEEEQQEEVEDHEQARKAIIVFDVVHRKNANNENKSEKQRRSQTADRTLTRCKIQKQRTFNYILSLLVKKHLLTSHFSLIQN